MVRRRGRIPLWIKLTTVLFLCVLVPVYWRHYGPANFLWASNVALFAVCLSAWLEKPLLNSMAAIGAFPFDLLWIVDFLSGAQLLGGTAYMFNESIPLFIRGLSLYHFVLPPLIVFLLFRLGYDRRALHAQILLAWILLPLSYLFSDPTMNVNFVFGPGTVPQTTIPPLLYLGIEMALIPVLVFLPAHVLLKRFFRHPERNFP